MLSDRNKSALWRKQNGRNFGDDISIIFSCEQAALWMVLSVCLSVCPSHLFHNVPVIVSSGIFQKLLPLTEMMSMQKVKARGQMSRSQMWKQILPQFWHFRTVTPVLIHRCLRMSEWVFTCDDLFRTAGIGVHVVHISRVIKNNKTVRAPITDLSLKMATLHQFTTPQILN